LVLSEEYTGLPDNSVVTSKNERIKGLKQIVTALQAALADRLVAVVLFGSQARGDASQDSDWDVLVIAEALPEKSFERHMFVKRLLLFEPDVVVTSVPYHLRDAASGN